METVVTMALAMGRVLVLPPAQKMYLLGHSSLNFADFFPLDALTDEGGIQICGNAQNCVAVCPKEIPLTTSIARAGRATTLHTLRKWFDK